MPTEEGYLFRHAPSLIDRYDSEGTSATGFPINSKVFWVCLDQVGVPRVLGNAKVVVALFLPKDTTISGGDNEE
jgi:hypothetical protein